MKFTATKTDLVKALTVLAKVLPKRAVQPVLSNVLIDIDSYHTSSMTAIATDLDNTLRLIVPILSVEEIGTVSIDAKHVLSALKTLPKTAEVITIEHDSILSSENFFGSITFRSGSSSFTSKTIAASDFPDMLVVKDKAATTLSSSELCTICEKVAFSASQIDTNSVLGGVSFRQYEGAGLEVAASDRSRLTAYTPVRPVADKSFDFILPVASVKLLAQLSKFNDKKYSPAYVSVGTEEFSGKVTFSTPKGCLTSNLIKGEYPRYTELFPTNLGGYRILEKVGLLSACEAVIAKKEDRHNALTIVGLEVGSTDGEFRSSLNGCSSNPVPISLNANYLKQWITANDCTEVKIKVNDDKILSPVLLEGHQGDIRHLIMPVSQTTRFDQSTSKHVLREGWWSKYQLSNQSV